MYYEKEEFWWLKKAYLVALSISLLVGNFSALLMAIRHESVLFDLVFNWLDIRPYCLFNGNPCQYLLFILL